MKERLCVPQFIHPGREHGWNEVGHRGWNTGDHRRKFLAAEGGIAATQGDIESAEICFWGEWEPDSDVEQIESPLAEGPRFLHRPYLPSPGQRGSRQNTDPFVFGDGFRYVWCQQYTKRGRPTQMAMLTPGSVILFGSCLDRSKFVLDTVFVIASFEMYGPADRKRVGQTNDAVYRSATLDSLSLGNQQPRLYRGATPADPYRGMYSFFPCRRLADAPNGFARPEVTLPEIITRNQYQGRRVNRQTSINHVAELWWKVVREVRAQGLELGVSASLPEIRRVAGRRATRAVATVS